MTDTARAELFAGFARLEAGRPYYDIPADAPPLVRANLEALNEGIAEGWALGCRTWG